jgi:hypothetical protein
MEAHFRAVLFGYSRVIALPATRRLSSMTSHETANNGGPLQTTQHEAKSRHGFILSTILGAFEAYGAALCGHIAIDPAADSVIDHPASKPTISAIAVHPAKTPSLAKSRSHRSSPALPQCQLPNRLMVGTAT